MPARARRSCIWRHPRFLAGLAPEAGIEEPDAFARQWHILMKGSIVAAAEGDAHAGHGRAELGRLLLADQA